MMKRTFLILSILASIALTAAAQQNSQVGSGTAHTTSSTKERRAPKRVNTLAYITYNEEIRMIEISSSITSDAEVLLCDELGNVIDSATTLNTSFYIPQNECGCYSVRIECDDRTLVKYITVPGEI